MGRGSPQVTTGEGQAGTMAATAVASGWEMWWEDGGGSKQAAGGGKVGAAAAAKEADKQKHQEHSISTSAAASAAATGPSAASQAEEEEAGMLAVDGLVRQMRGGAQKEKGRQTPLYTPPIEPHHDSSYPPPQIILHKPLMTGSSEKSLALSCF